MAGAHETSQPLDLRPPHEHVAERTEEVIEGASARNEQPDLYARCLTMWSIQDSLLQSYRGLMLTSQSILLAIAVFAAQSQQPWLALLPAIPGLLINWDWKKLVQNRGVDVYYFQWQLLRLEAGISIHKDVLTEFKRWQKNSLLKRIELLQRDPLSRQLVGGRGARRLDKQIPFTLRCCWAIIILFVLRGLLLKLVLTLRINYLR